MDAKCVNGDSRRIVPAKFPGTNSVVGALINMKTTFPTRLAAAIGTVLTCLFVPLSGLGATANVQVVSYQFIPATTNIAVNDQVTWTWPLFSGFHDATSDDGIWASPTQIGPASYSYTFTAAGTYPYTCSIHYFTGTINVIGPNQSPSVSITNPADGTVFSEPAYVTIQASATDDGTVTNVQFLVGTTVLADQAVAPFSAVAGSLAAGSYALSAVASDNFGLMTTNSVNITVVTPLPLALVAPRPLAPARFQFNYPANVGLSYVVQQSTNLGAPDWVGLLTNQATANPMTFVDSNAVANPGFYRVIRLPNP